MIKKIKCAYKGCSSRRLHHEKSGVKRKHQVIEVDGKYKGKAYCSFECALYDGAIKIKSKN